MDFKKISNNETIIWIYWTILDHELFMSDSYLLSRNCSSTNRYLNTRNYFIRRFNDNKNNWTVAETKKVASRIEGGFYYLTALGHAYGEAHEVNIDTRKDFQIEARIKIISGNSEH